MNQSALLVTHLRSSHRLILMATFVIVMLGYLATFGVFLSGKSAGLTLSKICIPLLISIVILLITSYITKKLALTFLTKYVVITSVGLLLFIYDCFVSGTPEGYQNLYFLIALSILYFDLWVSIYAGILTLVLHTIFLSLVPAFLPSGQTVALLTTRYTDLLSVGVILAIAAYAGSKLVKGALQGQEEALHKSHSLTQIALGVMEKADLIFCLFPTGIGLRE